MAETHEPRGTIPPGWWEDHTVTPEEAALLDEIRSISQTLPRPPGLGPPGSTFELTRQEDADPDDA